MCSRKKGFFEGGNMKNHSVLFDCSVLELNNSIDKASLILGSSFTSNCGEIFNDSLNPFSSNRPGFIGFITNKGKDDNLLKGGFRKI